MIGQDKTEPAGAHERRPGSARAIGLALAVALAVLAAPVGVRDEGGGVSVSSKAAFAQGKSDKGNNGRGNGGGNGGGNAGGSSSGNGGAGAGADAGGTQDGRERPSSDRGRGVVVAQFTTEIRKRLPVNNVERIDDPYQAISFFTEVEGLQGHTVTHRWIYKGVVQYRVSFPVHGPDSKMWSTQFLPDNMPGTWLVEVVDDEANILTSSRLEFRPAG